MHGDHFHRHSEEEADVGAPPSGHNGPPGSASQWQRPHLTHDTAEHTHAHDALLDLDLVEAAFVDAVNDARDIVSLLRLANVPFVGETPDGARLHLIRVALDDRMDVGSAAPAVGGRSIVYQPLPSRLVSRRRELRLIYHDGRSARGLTLAEAKALVDRSERSAILLTQD